jgi:hypothetical protein
MARVFSLSCTGSEKTAPRPTVTAWLSCTGTGTQHRHARAQPHGHSAHITHAHDASRQQTGRQDRGGGKRRRGGGGPTGTGQLPCHLGRRRLQKPQRHNACSGARHARRSGAAGFGCAVRRQLPQSMLWAWTMSVLSQHHVLLFRGLHGLRLLHATVPQGLVPLSDWWAPCCRGGVSGAWCALKLATLLVHMCLVTRVFVSQGPAWVAPALTTDVVHSQMVECSNMVRKGRVQPARLSLCIAFFFRSRASLSGRPPHGGCVVLYVYV